MYEAETSAISCYWLCYVRMFLLKINSPIIDTYIFWFCTYRLTPHNRDTAWTGAYWVRCDLSTMTQSPHTLTVIAQVTVPKALKFTHHKKYVCNHFTFILCSTFPPYCSTSVRRTVRRPLRAAFKTAVKPSCRQANNRGKGKAKIHVSYLHIFTIQIYRWIAEENSIQHQTQVGQCNSVYAVSVQCSI